MTLTAYPSTQESLGYFRLFARPPGGIRREITIFRGAPVRMENASFTDPFTHETASISLPQVTVFDNPGEGDLDWLVANCDIDIVWQNTGPYAYDWTWEGFIASYQFSIDGTASSYQVDLKGALFGLDDYLAIPTFPKRPIPYEILIAKAFDQAIHPCWLGNFRVLFPNWWTHDGAGVRRPDLPGLPEALGCDHRSDVDRVHLTVHRLLGAPVHRACAEPAHGDVRGRWSAVERPQPGRATT